MPDLSEHTKRFFRSEIANEREGGVSPATVQSSIDSYLQAPDVFFPDADVRQAVTDELLALVAFSGHLDTEVQDLLTPANSPTT